MEGTCRIRVVDSHTEGEPTRVVVQGAPDLRASDFAGRVRELRSEHDALRSGIVCEPRGHEAIVGAYLLPPSGSEADFGAIFFNNAGYLGMCGHGTIGLVATLAHLGRLEPGPVRFETPAGIVRAELHPDGRVSVWNVKSYRLCAGVEVELGPYGRVRGDIAYGGNWFFLTELAPCRLEPKNIPELIQFTAALKRRFAETGITGAEGAEIDHVEVFGPPQAEGTHAKNFVLCPGLAYDRSPCGTGLSAKLACLDAEGKLAPGEVWIQESIIGSTFEGRYERDEGGVWPQITGRAWVTCEADLIFAPDDPFAGGIIL